MNRNPMISQMLSITTHDSVASAPHYGDTHKALKLVSAVVVGQGTEGNRATVDLVLEDENGNKFVAMTTGALLRGAVAAVDGVEFRTLGGGAVG